MLKNDRFASKQPNRSIFLYYYEFLWLATSNTDLRHLEVFSAVARFFDLYEGALELTASGLRKQVECREPLQFSLERLSNFRFFEIFSCHPFLCVIKFSKFHVLLWLLEGRMQGVTSFSNMMPSILLVS